MDERLVTLLAAAALGIADRLREATEAAAGQVGGGPAALVALADMADGGTVDRLRRVLGLTPSGAVRLVDRLVAAGLAERRPGADARSLALVLTAAGRRAAAAVAEARAGAVRDLVAELPEADRAELERLAEALVGGLVRARLGQRAAGREPAGGFLCRLCDMPACGRPEGRCPAATAAAASGD